MLDDDAIARYARQIVIPGFGAAGQQKLLTSTILVVGDERGCRQAALYLRAAGAGVAVEFRTTGHTIDLVIVAGADTLSAERRVALLALGKPLCWYVTGAGGFTSGVHPVAPLPCSVSAPQEATEESDARHDAAACDAASVACAILSGLAWRSGPFLMEC